MKSLLRRFWHANSSILAISQTALANIGIQAVNICCGIITARTLAPSGRGELAAIIMWPQLLAYTLTLGTPVSYIYHFKKQPQLARQLSGGSILLSLASGFCGSVIGWFIIPYSLRTYPLHIIHFAQATLFLVPLGLCSVVLTAQLQSAGLFGHFNVFRFASPLSILVALVVLLFTGTLTPYNASLVYLLASMPVLIWLCYMIWKTSRPVFTGTGHAIKLLLNYGVKAWGADLLGTVADKIDRVLVVGMLSPASMGLYVVAQSVAGLLTVVPSAVNPVILPRMAGTSNKEVVAVTGAATRITFFVMFLTAVPLALFGTFMLRLVYGNKFDGAGAILPFLLAESVIDGITSVLSQAFLGAGLPGMVTLLQGCGVITAIPLMYFLIPRWGIGGAACALMLSTFCRFIFILTNYPIRLKHRPPRLFIGREEIIRVIKTRQLVPVVQDT